MLKRDPLGSLLAGAILLAVIVTAAVCYWYLICTRQHNRLQIEAAIINRDRSIAQQAAAEALDYGRRNPTILPILQQVGILQRPATNQESIAR